MSTTIQVSGTTKQMLDSLKEKERMKTYDQVLQHLLTTHTDIPKSMFGAARGMLNWKKEEDRLKLHEL